MSQPFLPYGRQWIDDEDIAAVTRVLKSDYLTTGPEIEAFETEFAAAVDAPYAVACNSATAALHLALAGLGIGEGDVCIVPTITFLSTANAARFCGAEVVFADVDPETGLMTRQTLEEVLDLIEWKASAVLPVHLAGAVCDMAGIEELAEWGSLKVIEDSCHALGSRTKDGPVGNCRRSDAATFSFHPVKTLAAGEGGMLVTDNKALAETAARLRSHGVERDRSRFTHLDGARAPWAAEMQALGFNYRMPDINAALGRSQLAKLAFFAARRRELVALYREALLPLSTYVQPPLEQPNVDPCRHLMNVEVMFGISFDRPEVMERMRSKGVGTQVHYVPVHHQPYYAERYRDALSGRSFPGTRRYYGTRLSLPLYPSMQDEDVQRVADALAYGLKL